MLATKGTHVPAGPEWLHEVKWDGMRVLVDVRPAEDPGEPGELHVRSRNEKDVRVSFPELHGLAGLGRDVLLDGEVVAFLDGIPTFGALADRIHVGNARRRGPRWPSPTRSPCWSSTCSASTARTSPAAR